MLVEALSGAFVAKVRGVALASTWANLLRVVADEGVALKDLPALTRLSRRAIKSVAHAAQNHRLVAIEGPNLRLTPAGRAVRPTPYFDAARCEPLAALVAQLELEHPHHLAPYGTADPSMTGGPGVDWKPVPRRPGGGEAALPIASLLSQALTAFAIDYERARLGPIVWAANLLAGIGDEGAPAAALPERGTHSVSNLVRLKVATVGAGGLLTLTPRGRAMRDAFAPLTARVEAEWRERHGADLIDAVIAALAAPDPDLPRFPVVAWTGAEFALMDVAIA